MITYAIRMARCGHCNEERDDCEYGVRDVRTGRTHTICRACRRGYSRKHYWLNHAKYNARKRERVKACRKRNRAFVATYLENRQCVDCGLVDALVMELTMCTARRSRKSAR